MAKRRSIGERLARAGSPEIRARILEDWTAEWRRDQEAILDELNAAIGARDWELVSSAAGQLSATNQKRFDALRRILDRVTYEEGGG